MKRVFALFLGFLLFAGDASGALAQSAPLDAGATKRVPAKGSVIYIVWPKFFLELPLPDSLKADWSFYVDGKLAGKMTSGDYLVISVAPGKRTLSYDNMNLLNSVFGLPKREADVKPGGARYFGIIYENAGPYILPFLREISERDARSVMPKLRRRK